EAGQIQNPRKIVCPAESVFVPFHSLGFSAKWVLTFSNKHHQQKLPSGSFCKHQNTNTNNQTISNIQYPNVYSYGLYAKLLV
ncbi:MAG: hypothetical protein WCW34_00005, partial [Patescibacteria group bacterium]